MNPGYYIWLSELCGAGSPLAKKAYELFDGEPERIYRAEKYELEKAGLSPDEAELLSDKNFERANRIIDFCAENEVGLLTFDSCCYPQCIYGIENPPPVLYYRGRIEKLSDGPFITAVGSRDCTEAGYRNGYTVAYRLSCSGMNIVAGMADGIDSACTKGALDAGGFAVGILGSGINIHYPFDNGELYERMFRQGLVITEFSPYTEPKGTNFPIRNRLMAALGSAALVVEARKNSGALITAELAQKYGKKIYVVPGEPFNLKCEGSNELIRNGAHSVFDELDILADFMIIYPDQVIHRRENRTSGTEVLADFPKHGKKKRKNPIEKAIWAVKKRLTDSEPRESAEDEKTSPEKRDVSALEEKEAKIYEFIFLKGEATADMLAAELEISHEKILSALTMLEIYGYIESSVGGTYITI